MEAHFPRKSLATCREASLPQAVLLAVLNYLRLSQKCISSRNVYRLRIPVAIVHTCFDKNTLHYNVSTSDFTSGVLIRMLPGALNRLAGRPYFTHFVLLRRLCGVHYYYRLFHSIGFKSVQLYLPHNWINKNRAKITFLPLDWIYHDGIIVYMVRSCYSHYCHKLPLTTIIYLLFCVSVTSCEPGDVCSVTNNLDVSGTVVNKEFQTHSEVA